MRHGRGKVVFDDGRTYEGKFAGGYPHGKGKSREPSGTGYDGDFKQGAFHGKGTLLLGNLRYYQAELDRAYEALDNWVYGGGRDL